jgi:hypothetical protein
MASELCFSKFEIKYLFFETGQTHSPNWAGPLSLRLAEKNEMVQWVVFVLVTEKESPAAVAENTTATVSDAGEEEVDAGG